MSLDYINEAFRSLESLNEDIFSVDHDGINELSDFMSSDVDDEEKISIIDMDAETEEDLQDSYVGKIICDCNVCHSHVFKDKDQITIDDDGVVDIEDDCPYCGEHNGFVIIGEITEFNPNAETEEEVEETPAEEPAEEEVTEEPAEEVDDEADEGEEVAEVEEEEEVLEESLNEAPRKFKPHTMRLLRLIGSDLVNDAVEENLEESFNNVSIETDDQKMTMTSEENGKVTVTTEPIENVASEEESIEVTAESGDEVISPISSETEDALLADEGEEQPTESAEETEEVAAEEAAPADETTETEESELEADIDEIDEEAVDELGESYLKRVYENVDSFKTTSVSTCNNKLIIEGMINFKSGASKKTGFIFEAKEATRDGKVKFIGENAHLCRGKRAFTLAGSLNENKLMVESLTYNYRAKNSDGKSTRVYGTISRNK